MTIAITIASISFVLLTIAALVVGGLSRRMNLLGCGAVGLGIAVLAAQRLAVIGRALMVDVPPDMFMEGSMLAVACFVLLGVISTQRYYARMATDLGARMDLEREITAHIENTPFAVLQWDRNLRFQRWAGRAEEIFGWPADEIVGRSWPEFAFVHEDDQERVGEVARDLLERKVRHNTCVNRNYTRDGRVVHCAWHNSVMFDEDGNVSSFLSLVQDVSEPIQTEAALRASEERYRSVVEDQDEMICRFDTDYQLTFVNQSYADAFGLAPDALIGTEFFSLIPETDHDAVRASLESLGPDRLTTRTEYPVLHPDGSLRWQEWTDRAFVDTDGNIIGYQAIGRDVTGRRRAAFERARLAAIVEATSDAVIIADADRKALFINAAGRAALGLGDQPLHQVSLDSIHVEPETLRAVSIPAAISDGVWAGDAKLQALDGEEIPVSEVILAKAGRSGAVEFLAVVARDVTERLAADRSVRENEERLRLALEAVRGGTWDWHVGRGYVHRSRQWHAAFEFDPRETPGVTDFWESRVHPDDLERIQPLLEEIKLGQVDQYQCEYRFRTGTGRWCWVLDSGRVLDRDENGHALRVAGVDIDISDRRIAEDALEESEQRLELAAEGAALGIWDWDIETDSIVLSERYERMLGYEPGTIGDRGANWDRYVHPADLSHAREAIRDHLAGKTEILDVEYRMRTADGAWRWILDRGRVVDRDANGRALRMSGTHLDIQDRKVVEATLQQYRQAVESSDDAIAAVDETYTCLFANESYARDFPGVDVEGRRLPDVVGADHFFRFHKPHYDRCLRGESITVEVEDQNQLGRYRLVNYSPLRDASQRVIGVVTSIRDISKLKETERRQRLLMRELEHRVKNNLAGLNTLVKSQQAAHVTKEQFAEAMSSALGAMLTVHQLMANADDLRVDMATLPRRLIDELARSDGAVLERLHMAGPELRINARQSTPLAMILQELITNARKYGALRPGDGRVDLTWEVGDPSAEDIPIKISWRETGCGPLEPPARYGTGLDLIRGFAEFELRGSATFDFGPAGYTCAIDAVLDEGIDDPT